MLFRAGGRGHHPCSSGSKCSSTGGSSQRHPALQAVPATTGSLLSWARSERNLFLGREESRVDLAWRGGLNRLASWLGSSLPTIYFSPQIFIFIQLDRHHSAKRPYDSLSSSKHTKPPLHSWHCTTACPHTRPHPLPPLRGPPPEKVYAKPLFTR